MATTNSQRIQLAMQLLAQGLGPYIDRNLSQRVGGDWPAAVNRDGRVPSNAKSDSQFLLKAMIGLWREGGFADTLGHAGRSWVGELLDTRNRWAHNESFSSDQAYRALDTVQLLLNAIGAGELATKIDPLRQDLLRSRFAEEERTVRRRRSTAATEGQPAAGLRPWREVITPHQDVASGRYQQAEFAADLYQVWKDEGASEYRKPEEFFGRTYITEGLRSLLLNAVRRLRGEGGDPIVGLQTNFGGGKTHSLIALFHLAAGYPPASLPGVEQMLTDAGLGPPPEANVAVLEGQKLQPGSAQQKDDGTEVRTLWGELAWQLGGRDGYAVVAEADRTGTNPGAALIQLFRQHSPCLILIDEWVAYARQLYGEDARLPAGSFDTQFTFAQALTDAAKAVPNAMLVVSIPASDIEVGGEGGRQALIRLENVVGRMETSWKPATADEGFEIVRRRLFEAVSPDVARERDAAVHAFGELYRGARGEFPVECGEGEYERRLRTAYPIHPELFDRLYGEWSTLERFQRTRGVLRLMAAVIYELWRREDRSLLIMPGMLPIEASQVVDELTRYLDEPWTPVISTDVDGENALPLRIDNQYPAFMRYSAARRVARTIFLGSAPIKETANRGIDDRRVKLGCVQPGEPPATFGDALRRLSNEALYLSTDGRRYWYSLQQTVTRLAADRAALVRDDQVDHEIEIRVRKDRERGDFVRVHPVPEAPGDIDDEDAVRLVVLSPAHPHSSKSEESPARAFAQRVLDERAGGPRLNRNMLAFAAADSARLEDLRDAVRNHMAWDSIAREQDSLNLDTVQRSQVTARRTEWDESVDQRLHESYQWLLVPSVTPGEATVRWEAVRIGGGDPLALRASRKLRSEEGLITTYSGARLRMDLDRIPLWRDSDVAVRDLWSYYAQYLYLPRLRDVSVLLSAVADGVGRLDWKQDGFAYAEGWDETSQRYAGLRAGEGITLGEPRGLVVKPTVATIQLDAAQAATASATGARGETTESQATGATAQVENGATVADMKPRRFYGAVELDPLRLTRDAGQIAEAIVQHLTGLVGGDVKVRLEVEAEVPDGVPEDVVRTVTENARTLRFDPHGFERE
jgi:predicted AAA+ superfamily ATPase